MAALKTFLLFNILAICHGQGVFNAHSQNIVSDQYDVEDADIERPCEVFDKFCIRKFFKEHSHCKPVDGPVPDPLYRDQLSAYIPHVNITFNANNIMYTGLNGRIEEFFINRKTDRLVLAVEFTNLNTSSGIVNIRFHLKGQEPIILSNYASIQFRSIVVTIVIPNLNNLQLHKAQAYSYVNDASPAVVVGAEELVTSDPTVLRVMAEFMATIPLTAQESQLTEAPFIIGSFIQWNICDFGLKIV